MRGVLYEIMWVVVGVVYLRQAAGSMSIVFCFVGGERSLVFKLGGWWQEYCSLVKQVVAEVLIFVLCVFGGVFFLVSLVLRKVLCCIFGMVGDVLFAVFVGCG